MFLWLCATYIRRGRMQFYCEKKKRKPLKLDRRTEKIVSPSNGPGDAGTITPPESRVIEKSSGLVV